MKPEYRASLNALSTTRDERLPHACKSVGLSKKDALVAFSSGLGEAVVQRRDKAAAARAKSKAAKAARRRNR